MSEENKTVQEKIDDIGRMIEWFDSTDFTPEKAIEKYRQLEDLTKEVEASLLDFKNQVDVIKKKFDK